MKPDKAEKLLVWILRTAGIVCALAIIPMLMPTAWTQTAHAAICLGELPGKPIVVYLVRGMSAGLLLLLAGGLHRDRRVVKFQAAAILTLATYGSILMHHLPVLGNYILIDGAVCWL